MGSPNQQQTWGDTTHGSRVLCQRGCLPALAVDQTQGKARVRLSGIGRNPAVAARPGIVATVSGQLIRTVRLRCSVAGRRRDARSSSPSLPSSIAPASSAVGHSRGLNRPGRRAVVLASKVRQLAPNSCRTLTRRGCAKPLRTDASACKPSAQSHLDTLSSASVAMTNRDTKGNDCAGTTFLGAGNVRRH